MRSEVTAPDGERPPEADRHPLRHRQFVGVLLGQFLSQIGDFSFRVALPLAVLGRHGSGGLLATVLLAQAAALLLATLAGGVIADRRSARGIMVALDLARFTVLLGAAVAIVQRTLPAAGFVAVGALLGAGQGFFQPAYSVASLEIVSPSRLPEANRYSALARRSASIAGPALGGLLVIAGAAWGFAANAVSFLVAAACTAAAGRWPRSHDRRPPRRPLADLREGLAYARQPRIALPIAGFAVAIVATFSPAFVVLPVVLAGQGRPGAWSYSAILVGLAAGGVAGTLLTRRGAVERAGWTRAAMLALAVTGVSYATVALGTHWLPLAVAAAFPAGFATAASDLCWATALQTTVPREILGRVASVDLLASFGLAPLAYAVLGPLVTVTSPILIMVVGGGVTAMSALAIAAAPALRRPVTSAPEASHARA